MNVGINDGLKPIVKGDAWFGSVKAAGVLAKEGFDCVLQVKIGHALCPKDFIADALDKAPGGTHIVIILLL